MKRKLLVLMALAAFVAGGAFAQVQFSAGGGFVFDGGRLGGYNYDFGEESGSFRMNHFGFGGFVFLDATFAELTIGLMGGPTRSTSEISFMGLSDGETYDGSFMAMDVSLLGKFPIHVGGGSTVFPLLGFGYNLVLSASDEDGNDVFEGNDQHSAADLSAFRIKLGVGGDFNLSQNVFFRASLLGYYRFASSFHNDMADLPDVESEGGFGGIVRLAIGFRF